MKIKLFGLTEESIVDGKGIRYSVFTQGCPHKCEACHNPESWDFNKGEINDTDKIFEDFKENPILKGITFSGGEPFMQAEALFDLAKKVHSIKKDVTVYTGYTYEELMASNIPFAKELLSETDVLIDGKFILEQKNLELLFRGSENQRLIDMNKTRETATVCLLEE
ncbi:MAG: anaerobic ribonucleoside-triphosphate reductase activating protein [Clostridia bacterium]